MQRLRKFRPAKSLVISSDEEAMIAQLSQRMARRYRSVAAVPLTVQPLAPAPQAGTGSTG